MAPRRGGGGGSGGSSSGSSTVCDSDYPCTSELNYMYGFHSHSLWSNNELYGQLAMSIIWTIAFGALLCLPRKPRGLFLPIALVLFLISFIFLDVRYGLITGGSDVPIGYRYESSIVVLMQRLGMIFVFASVHHEARPGLVSKIAFGIGLGIYGMLNVAYSILDFLITANGLQYFKDNEEWRLSDRDFAVTMDNSMIYKAKTQAYNGEGLDPDYVRSRFYDPLDPNGDAFLHNRDIQVKIGTCADVIAFVLALSLLPLILMTLVRRRKQNGGTLSIWLLIAVVGLLLTTLFRMIVSGHYILHNWGVISDFTAWINFRRLYPGQTSVFDDIIPPAGFLEGYRITADGFPIIQALFEPLGVFLACLAIVCSAWRERGKTQPVTTYQYGPTYKT